MTLADLRALWSQRDYRYSFRRHLVSDGETEQVRRWRQMEADTLAPPVRATAYREATMWTPPERVGRMVR